MANVALTPIDIPSYTAQTGQTITWTDAAAADTHQLQFIDSVVLVRNGHGASAKTVTVTSVQCSHGRTGNIAAQSIAAGVVVVMPRFKMDGWAQTTGKIHFNGEDTNIKFAALKLPVS